MHAHVFVVSVAKHFGCCLEVIEKSIQFAQKQTSKYAQLLQMTRTPLKCCFSPKPSFLYVCIQLCALVYMMVNAHTIVWECCDSLSHLSLCSAWFNQDNQWLYFFHSTNRRLHFRNFSWGTLAFVLQVVNICFVLHLHKQNAACHRSMNRVSVLNYA